MILGGFVLRDVWFGVIFFVLGMYLFLDGFDLGVGTIYATRDEESEKEILLGAIGPFWDGNEVWLVVFGGSLFAVFPPVYANLFGRNYLLMFGILATLILRGLSPEFREQREDGAWRSFWDAVFVVGSTGTAFLLGVFVANWLLGDSNLVVSVLAGLVVVTLTFVEGATFLGIKTRGSIRAEMVEYARKGVLVYVALAVGLLAYLAFFESMEILSVFGLSVLGITLAFCAVVFVASGRGRYYVSFGASAGLAFALVGLVAFLLYPVLDPGSGLTVEDAVISDLPLRLMTMATAVLIPVVLVYFGVLYSVFSGPVEEGRGY